MAEILPGIHTVDGVNPSPDFTTHVYLVKEKGESWTLVDTGLPQATKAIEAYLEKNRIAPRSIRSIVITHLHRDHTGGLETLAQLTGARTYAHWLEAAFIAQDPPYDGPGVPPEKAVDVDERIKDGETLDVMGGTVAYHTPGHTPGHTSYYLPNRGILFSGDLFFGNGSGIDLTPPEYTHHTVSAKVSARRMAELKFDSLLTYHGGPVLKGGRDAVHSLVKRL